MLQLLAIVNIIELIVMVPALLGLELLITHYSPACRREVVPFSQGELAVKLGNGLWGM